ncbi:complex I subunit 4 family protein [Thermicanus aegyptius]|uniref:complex I subunit 4 family protein n=1 Tax=Thermicanus aegyptius TaxID=94009 RepID=UPI0003F51DD7|nr:NADH-quinone oxidoreductase subunit M [Thermicanus aegyptius]
MPYLLTSILLSPLLGILILSFIPKEKGGLLQRIGILSALLPLLLTILLFAGFDIHSAENQFTENAEWFTLTYPVADAGGQLSWQSLPIQYTLAVDGISMPLLLMTAIVGFLAAAASYQVRRRVKEYFLLFLALEIGMFGVFMAQNLLLFFIFFEVTLVTTFLLVGIWGFTNREKAANSFLLYNGLGSLIMLVAFLLLFNQLYTFDMPTIRDHLAGTTMNEGLRAGLFFAILVAFGIKLPIFPFHSWMLKVHVEAPVPIVMIHSGVLLKMGAYGLLRFGIGFFPDLAPRFAWVLALLGLVNILYGAIIAFVQRDLKRMMAFSSISHMGVVLFGLAALNAEGIQGSIFQMISHGFISALLFFMIGVIYERTGTSNIDELGGLARSMPFAGGVFLTAAMASLGLPLLSGFISEFQAFLGLFLSDLKAYAAVGTLGLILTAAYMLRTVLRTTFGPIPERWKGLNDVETKELIPIAALLALILLIGIYPAALSDPLQATITDFLGRIGG